MPEPPAAPGWIDSHCHLPGDPAEAAPIVARAAAAGVERVVVVGTDLATSRAAVETAARLPAVAATVGLHPHDADRLGAEWDDLVALTAAPGVVAVGEAGLDHHYDHSPRAAQAEAFRAQIGLAHERGLALVIHTREAWEETFAVLDAEGPPERTVFHCFTGGEDEARACLARGAWLSFSGIVTFKNAADVRAAAAIAPADRYLVETDSPYLAPVPHRGRTNEPAWVTVVGAGVAAARDETPEAVRAATAANARSVFGGL